VRIGGCVDAVQNERMQMRRGHVDVNLLELLGEKIEDTEDYTDSDYAILYAIGFVFVDRIGVDSLYQLCLDHEDGVPPSLILERAGIAEDGTGL
jgi:hypothetical protein